jgi:dihydroorotate dehydrogenase
MIFFRIRNGIFRFIYKGFLKRIFFLIDPEKIHDFMIIVGSYLGRFFVTRKITSFLFNFSNRCLEQRILGITFKNPIGLAAGFDKNAKLLEILPDVGFGFAEIGSITGEPYEGNKKPRLFRLQKTRSLIVNYGLKNDGCEVIAKKLDGKKFRIPIAFSIAKTNSPKTVDIDAGVSDYIKAYKYMSPLGEFHVINISCPNAFGGEPFTDSEKLKKLILRLENVRVAAPILIKLSPDLSHVQIDSILEIALHNGINGVICSNLTKDRKNPNFTNESFPIPGGISGKLLENKANDLIKYIYKKTAGQVLIIGCGGVSSAEDAYKKIRLGASLIELITGMIYEGPQLISDINLGLVDLLKRDGFSHISEVIGIDNRI